jgi:hypothetical protein
MSSQNDYPDRGGLPSRRDTSGFPRSDEYTEVTTSVDSRAGGQGDSTDPGSSALDELEPCRPRPTGAMTLLRNNLMEERNDRGGWMEKILTRRTRVPGGSNSIPAEQHLIQPGGMATDEDSSPRPHASISAMPEAFNQPDSPIAEVAAALPAAGEPLAGVREARDDRQAVMIGVITAIAFAAITSFTVLRVAGDWAGVLPLLTLVLLGVSLIGILHRRGAHRAFWQGFAILGFGYFALAFVPYLTRQAGLELPTSRALRAIHAWTIGPKEGQIGSSSILENHAGVLDGATASTVAAERPKDPFSLVPATCDLDEFVVVGHCWFALMAALFGSAISIWFDRSNLAALQRLPRTEALA